MDFLLSAQQFEMKTIKPRFLKSQVASHKIYLHGNWLGSYWWFQLCVHYSDVSMSAMAYQITGVSIVYSTVCSGANERKHQRSASLAFVWGIHRWPVNSPHKWPASRKMFPFDDVIRDNDFTEWLSTSSVVLKQLSRRRLHNSILVTNQFIYIYIH